MTAALTPSAEASTSLDDRIAVACGHLNAYYAQLVELLREVIDTEAWRGWGIHAVEPWISWRTGLSRSHAKTLVALAEASDSHPHVSAAFGSGELSVDQAALAIQARPEHEADVADWAKTMTLAQLRLAVRSSNTSAADREACAARAVGAKDADADSDADTDGDGDDGAPAESPGPHRGHVGRCAGRHRPAVAGRRAVGTARAVPDQPVHRSGAFADGHVDQRHRSPRRDPAVPHM
jgi:hypothetical protein